MKINNSGKVVSCLLCESSQKHIRGVTVELKYQIDNIKARIACSIIEGIYAIKSGRTEFDYTKRTIIRLKSSIKESVDDPDHMVDDAQRAQ